MSRIPFIDRCLAGDALAEEIDDDIDLYHEEHRGQPQGNLWQYLGFTRDEYKMWVEQPDTLSYIIAARRRKIPVSQVVKERLAARGTSSDEKQLLAWLKERNYIV